MVKRWPGTGHLVLDGICLEVRAGSVVRITGENGAGKTTLLRIVAGLLLCDRGAVRVQGRALDRDPTNYRRQVGFVGAGSTGLYARLSVERHLDLCARLSLMPPRDRGDAIQRVSETFALAELTGRRLDRLSMGQRQRVRLALAFLHEPALIALDEPLTSLDDRGVNRLERALRDLRARGAAAVVSTPTEAGARLQHDAGFRLIDGRLEPA